MAAADVVRHVAAVVRRHGWLAGALFVRQILWPSSYRLCLLGLTASSARELPPPPQGLEQHIAAPAEVAELLEDGWLVADSMLRVAGGDRCVVQRLGGRVVGVGWLAMGPEVEVGPGVRLRLPEDAAYVYRDWTAPEVRGLALQARRELALLRLVLAEGRTRLMVYVERTNFRSLKGTRKAGYRPIGWIDVRERGDVARWRIRITEPAWSSLVPESGGSGQCRVVEDLPDPRRRRP